MDSSHNDNAQRIELSDFDIYLNSLDTIPLPFEYWSEDELPDLSVNYNKSLYPKFKSSQGIKPYGILFRTHKYSIIIECIEGVKSCFPNIICLDSTGFVTDSLSFVLELWGIYDKDLYSDFYISINEEGKIAFIDKKPSLIMVDSAGKEIGKQLYADTLVYDITGSGRLERNDGESDNIYAPL